MRATSGPILPPCALLRKRGIACIHWVAAALAVLAFAGCAGTLPAGARREDRRAPGSRAAESGPGEPGRVPAPAPLPGQPSGGPPEPGPRQRFSFEECRGECIRILLESDDDYPFVADYLRAVSKRISLNLVFPWQSIQRGPEGEVGIRFRIDRKGQLASKEILRGSGVRVLDDAAMDSIVKGAPFSPFPPSPYIAGINVRAGFRFRP